MCARGVLDEGPLERWLEDEELPRTHAVQPDDRLISPILPREVGKILALGKNFSAHAAEFGEEPPKEPLFFNKLCETITGHNAVVSPPRGYTGRMDHEVELAVLIGRRASEVEENSAMDYVGGYTIANDLTLRSQQGKDRDNRYPWFRSKNFVGACPLGPSFAPTSELDISSLEITALVNGEIRQQANTRDMLTTVPQAVSFLSQHLPLFPGDLILMGTPAGVGPLEDGDEVTCCIEGLGELTTHIRRR
jgi:2-keto-4-pentenoate hydratase/2-oxohepta-3-ene-1,7-dioic acid hydratase in catechol pathway